MKGEIDIDVIDAELKTVLDCVRLEIGTLDAASVQSARSPDWERVDTIAATHELRPIVARQAQTLADPPPASIHSRLQSVLHRNAERNLQHTAALFDVMATVEDERVRAIPYKGPTLSYRAYGDTSLRQFADLDFLVLPRDVPTAVDILTANDYSLQTYLPPSRTAAEIVQGKNVLRYQEFVFEHDRSDITVELRWDLRGTTTPPRLSVQSLWNRRQSLAWGGIELPVLDPVDCLLVLADHGTRHHWPRLSWVADVAAYLDTVAPDTAALVDRAADLGVQQSLYTALILADELLVEPVHRA